MKEVDKSDFQDVYKTIGQGLKRIRVEQEKLGVGEFANRIGVHRNTVRNIENTEGDLSISTLIKIVNYSGMTLSKFFKSLGL